MSLERLCAAVQEAPAYMKRFVKREYTQAFREYTERFGPLYLEAVRETAGEAGALQALADGILTELEAGWKSRRPWNRGAARASEKQMVVAYLSPMLLGLEDPLCQELSELLRQGWAARWPKDAYQTATYQTLQRGFRNVILGIDLGRKRDGEAED